MNDQSVTRFCDDYLIKTKAYYIKDTDAKSCVRYTEAYIKDNENQRLSLYSAADIEYYLKSKAEMCIWKTGSLINSCFL